MPATPDSDVDEGLILDWLMPLHYFYARVERDLPHFEFLDEGDVPLPEHTLLVHEHDMTSTLTHYHASELGLSVVSRVESPDYLLREVVLKTADGRAAEYGAIGIRLEAFDEPEAGMIRAGTKPLGAILEDEGLHYHSRPKAWFRMVADEYIGKLLGEPPGTVLYGRCNALTDCEGIVFADIVEILPRALHEMPPGYVPPVDVGCDHGEAHGPDCGCGHGH